MKAAGIRRAAALNSSAALSSLPNVTQARDRGVNQPGAPGNPRADPGINQPGAAANIVGVVRRTVR